MTGLRHQVENIIREELDKAQVTVPWDMNEIHVLPDSKAVIEYTSSAGSLSEALVEHYFPAEPAGARFSHFTSMDSFKSILASNELRLGALIRKVNQQEFRPFSEDFGLSGYLDETDGEPYFKSLMADLFYTSFTTTEPDDPDYMWQVFGRQYRGVKITFEISPIRSRAELRKVRYCSATDAAKSLIASIMRRIKEECNRHFIMRGISRIGAFYLPLGYSLEREDETRLLVKSWGVGPAHDLISGNGDEAYIPLAFGSGGNEFCMLNIVEVQAGAQSDRTEIERALAASKFSKVPCGDA